MRAPGALLYHDAAQVDPYCLTHTLVSQPLAALPRGLEECLFTETMDPYLYARTTSDNRVMIGGEDDPFLSAAFRDRCLPAKSRALRRKFRRWFPRLEVRVHRAWAGAFAATKDGLGYVDETPLFPQAYFALGVGGNGMIFSVIAAGIIRDLYKGKKNRDRALFRFDRPGAARSGR